MLSIRIERWKFNKEYGVWVSTEGHFKDRHKRNLPIKVTQNGYCRVTTEVGCFLAHRIVLKTWYPISNPESMTVDHLDHNKRNNNLKNLEWVTYTENQRRATRDFVDTRPVFIYLNGTPFYSKKSAVNRFVMAFPDIEKRKVANKIRATIADGISRKYCGILIEKELDTNA